MKTRYLLLRFENAKLRFSEGEQTPSGNMTYEMVRNTVKPIGVNQLSGMIHAMFGVPPKPSKRMSVLSVSDELFELAKNSYIKYDMCDGRIGCSEFFKASKYRANSHSKIKDCINGSLFFGHYSWAYFKRCFVGFDSLFDEIISFFNKVTDCDDVCSLSFNDFLYRFWQHLDDDYVKDFFKNRLYDGGDFFQSKSREKPFTTPWITVLMNKPEKSETNGGYKGKNPLVLMNGVGIQSSFSGYILIPIKDEWMVDWLHEHGRIPTILDSGVVSVVSFNEYPPCYDFEDEYERVFDD